MLAKFRSGIADTITILTFVVGYVHPSMVSNYLCGFAAMFMVYELIRLIIIFIQWRNTINERCIKHAFYECRKPIRTLCGEQYEVICDLKLLKEHIYDELPSLNKALYESAWFVIGETHAKCELHDKISKWRSLFESDTEMRNRLDGLLAAVKVIKISSIQLRKDYRRDEIAELPDEQRKVISESIDEVLDLAYQYKAKYQIE